jgi:hypothetical protein
MHGAPYNTGAIQALDCTLARTEGPELKTHSRREPDTARDERRSDGPVRLQRPDEAPAPERRASYRVSDDQQSGQGSLSALSKLRMLERKRAALRAIHDEPPRILD